MNSTIIKAEIESRNAYEIYRTKEEELLARLQIEEFNFINRDAELKIETDLAFGNWLRAQSNYYELLWKAIMNL